MFQNKKTKRSVKNSLLLTFSLILPLLSNAQNHETSRFGVYGAYSLTYTWFQTQMGFTNTDYWNWVDNHFVNLGAHWTRSNNIAWDMIEPILGNGYDWTTNPFATDSVITNIYDSPADVNWLGSPSFRATRSPLDYPTEWHNFLTACVERYNGDGINDLNQYVKVKYWQINNEVFQISNDFTSSQYAQIFALSETAIHSVDTSAKLCLISTTKGNTVDTFLVNVITELANMSVPFDVMDIHHWGNASDYKITVLPFYRNLLDSLGYTNVEIWSCEHGTHTYQPVGFPFQTKEEQAASLLKRYVWNLNNGLSKLFWNNLMEWYAFAGNPNSVFNSMGLIGDGSYCGEPSDEFNHIRKSYFSYKILAENIDTDKASFVGNSSFHNESSGNYGYVFQDLNTSDSFEIFWTDNSSAVYTFNLNSTYELTNMVPVDDSCNFNIQTLTPGTHNISVNINEIYILKKKGTTGMSEIEIKSNLPLIYPNPTTDKIFIEINDFDEIELINDVGEIIFSTQDNPMLDLSNVPDGFYIVRINSDNQYKYCKIIKQ